MNAYRLLAIVLVVLLITYVFDLYDPVRELLAYLAQAIGTLAMRLADLPQREHRGPNGELVDLAVILAYLIALIGVVRLLIHRRKDKDE